VAFLLCIKGSEEKQDEKARSCNVLLKEHNGDSLSLFLFHVREMSGSTTDQGIIHVSSLVQETPAKEDGRVPSVVPVWKWLFTGWQVSTISLLKAVIHSLK